MKNEITTARYTAMDDSNIVMIYYKGWNFNGTIEILQGFFPCSESKLKKLLQLFKDPLGAEYKPLCWYLYQEASEMSNSIGAAGKRAGNMLLKDLDILAKELNIQ